MCIVHNENWVALIKNIIHADASEMLLAAVEALLADDGFSVTSTLSENAVTSAILFRSWGNANKMMFENVATEIVCDLEAIFKPANTYSVDLTFEEASALRYAAGYVCRALKKKFAADSELVECIDELVKDESDEGPDSTSEWTQLASRGGLVHISDSTYRVFHAMELVVRQRFQKGSVNPHPRNKK